jgi:hypothetical protein
MLTELCKEINNWFECAKFFGRFTVTDGVITGCYSLQENQYFRIVGSVFNDGVYKFGDELDLTDETFTGAIWAMAVPKEVIALADDIKDWSDKYLGVDSAAMSPFNSESFGGYSYSKSGGSSSSGNVDLSGTWQGAFADRLNHWRKI